MKSRYLPRVLSCPLFLLLISICTLVGCQGLVPGSSGPIPLVVSVSGAGVVTSTPSGINCGSICTANFAGNTTVTLTASAGTGGKFTGWSGACSGTGTCSVVMTASTAVTATFAAFPTLQVTITPSGSGTVTSNPSGINCPGTCSASFASNTAVTLTASAGNGYSFNGWSGGGCTGTATCQVTLTSATSVVATFSAVPSSSLTVTMSGPGTGTVTSNPSGISCPTTCSASFANGTQVTLTAVPSSGSSFGGWSGACSGTGTCVVTLNAATTVNALFGGSLQSLNHIIIFAQENRSFDSYFGAMREYWAQNSITDQSFDGLPQFNPTSGAPPLQGPVPAVPGCDPAFPYNPNANPPETYPCTYDSNSPLVQSFHLITMCLENPSPSWNESHVDWDLTNPVAATPTLNGFVHTAGNDARRIVPPMTDTNGLRAMGYYDGNDLNYYYFMASQFATSDRWFSPAMSRTQINRMYLLSSTSQGHAYPLKGNDPQLSAKTIFEALQSAGISWKIYIHPDPKGKTVGSVTCAPLDTRPVCLYQVSYLNMFMYGNKVVNDPVLSLNLVPVTQFATDAQNGTLPQVALIEPASASGLDEHPADSDPSPQQPTPCCSVQSGALYASGIVNSLLTSPSWKDSALLFTYDEFGGFYDHVAPQPAVSPDGIKPSDLLAGDICTVSTGPNCDFVYTGYRVPLIVFSPFSKKNYVSHTVADETAMLKLVEERFGLNPLTARDAAQIDMGAEFFDFVNAPWATPPTPPGQIHNGQCYLDHLP
jgi:phospholipase C